VALAEGEGVNAAAIAIAAAALKCTRFGGHAGAPPRVEVDEFLAIDL
jgi:sulfofructose kinase